MAFIASKKAMLVVSGQWVVGDNSEGDTIHVLRLPSKPNSVSGSCEYYHALPCKFMIGHKLTTIVSLCCATPKSPLFRIVLKSPNTVLLTSKMKQYSLSDLDKKKNKVIYQHLK